MENAIVILQALLEKIAGDPDQQKKAEECLKDLEPEIWT